ncbi:MAG: DUF4340 domain-containing protein [Betaproteobacteria bacterium]|nr:MAG: DUF4340 domain-containing protein [Betaproteobacteria bacterium]
MSRKQFLWLMLAVLIMGGAGLALFWQDLTAYRDSGAKIGAHLLPQLKVSDVAKMRLQDATQEVTLVAKDKVWRVEQRGGYPADFAEISGLILKLLDAKVVQSEVVGASLHPRLDLVMPGKGAKEGTGTLVELSDAAGKPLVSMVLGKVSLKKDPMNPLPNARDGVPAGRHILVAGKGDNVFVVSDPLEKAVARPGAWLARDFFKVERIKTLQLAGEAANSWRITRDEEWGQWKFAAGGGQLDPSAAVAANNALSGLAFSDVILDDKTGTDKAVTLTAETFDNLTYTIKLAPHTDGDFVLRFNVAGTPPKTRKPEPKEKPEDAAKRDKEFAETLQRLEARVMLEQARSQWAYVVAGKMVAPLLVPRAGMVLGPRPQ